MRPHALNRPDDFRSKNLWKLYTLLNSLERYCIFTGADDKDKSPTVLYYIKNMSVGGEETQYAHYGFGDLPDRKLEWLRLELINIESGRQNTYTRTFETDALFEHEKPIEEILGKYNIRIPSDEELIAYHFEELINEDDGLRMSVPSIDGEKITFEDTDYRHWKEKRGYVVDKPEEVMQSLADCFKVNHVAFYSSKDDVRSQTFSILSKDIPGVSFSGKVVYYENYTDILLHYENLPDNVSLRDRNYVLEKLNEINAKGIIFIDKRYPKDECIKNLTTMRFYLDDKNRVCVSTMIDYVQWREHRWIYDDYTVIYLRRLLESIYPDLFATR